jgi:cysteine-S-conjugate beta-lyase
LKYDFDSCPERRGTDSLKWGLYDREVEPLWVADMDFASPEPVIRALRERAEHGVFGYPEAIVPGRAGALAELIAARMAARYGWQVSPEEVVLVPGVVTALNLTCHAVAAPGGAVAVQTPVYPPFLGAPGNAGMIRRDAELARGADGAYEIDFDAFERAIAGTGIGGPARLFVLCNPHNPVGRVFGRDELERMAGICLRHGAVICSDEIHSDLVFGGFEHVPTASLSPEIAARTVTLLAPSKTFNVAGLACSAAIIGDPELRRRFEGAGRGLSGWVNVMGLAAAEAAYRDGQEWLDQLLPYLQANRDLLVDFVRRELPGVSMAVPEGTYLAWLDFRALALEGGPYRFLLEKARVALNDGEAFGPGGSGFARLNFGCPRARLVGALERIREALHRSAL